MLGLILAKHVANRIGIETVKNPVFLATTGAAVIGAAAAEAIKNRNDDQEKSLDDYQKLIDKNKQDQQKQEELRDQLKQEQKKQEDLQQELRRERLKREELRDELEKERFKREQLQEAAKQNKLEAQQEASRQEKRAQLYEQKRKEELKREQDNARMRESIARFAICYYIARADGVLSSEENNSLARIGEDIQRKYKYDYVKRTLSEIMDSSEMNLITLEKYISDINPSSIAAFLSLADEIAEIDGNTTDSEKESIYKLRKYLTDRTGNDYLGNYLHFNTNVDLVCPCCTSPMKVIPYDNKAQCPYCGFFKYLQARNT